MPVLLFDGVCNLCNAWVQFILDHERDAELVFAPLQSEEARETLTKACGEERARELTSDEPGTVVVVDEGRVYTMSDAAFRLARHLRAPWRWFGVFTLVPRPIRDVVYRFIANNRYRWFGRTETCRVPTPELKRRFLAAASPGLGRSSG